VSHQGFLLLTDLFSGTGDFLVAVAAVAAFGSVRFKDESISVAASCVSIKFDASLIFSEDSK